jgi:hypothetical protein
VKRRIGSHVSRSGRTSAGSPGEASCVGNFPGQRGLLGTGRGKHDTDPVTQVVQVQPTRGLVLAQQRD